ncbi:hypothetical protein OG900_33075 [Streptomyces sp. NBC_00433]
MTAADDFIRHMQGQDPAELERDREEAWGGARTGKEAALTPADHARQRAAVEAIGFRPFAETDTRTLIIDNAPDVPNRYGSGSIRVADVTITYHRGEDGSRRITARVRGEWRRPDGEITDAPINQEYADGPTADWPDWLAGLAWYYHPEPHTVPEEAR